MRATAAPTTTASAYLVRGEDPALVGQSLRDVIQSLVGDRDPAMVVEELGGVSSDAVDLGALVDAITTPPMLSDLRVIVVREAGRLSTADGARIAEFVAQPVSGVVLVVASGGGTIPAALVKAVQKVGQVVDASPGTGRARSQWFTEQLHDAPVKLDAKAGAMLAEHLGGDLSRLRGMLDTLASAYGEGAPIDTTRLHPFLGEPGSVAPWDLTDAIADGDTHRALNAVERMLGAGGFHPLVVLAVLHRHFESMLRLDGSGVTSGEEAASLLGSRSVFPARKAMEQSRRLGSARLGRAIILLAEADLDVRGRSGNPDATTLEVLVGRLSRLGSVREPTRRKPSARRVGSSRNKR